jgi:putative membrane protein
MQMEAHQQAISLFEGYAQGGDNPQLKQWAAKTLPALKMHKTMADKLH